MEDSVPIRKAREEDIRPINELHRKVVNEINAVFYPAEAVQEWLCEISEENTKKQFENSTWVIAKIAGKVIGFGQYSVADGEVYQINVAPDYLNRGVGKSIYNYIENDFRDSKVEKICLNSTLNAIGFYQKLGFNIMKEIDFKLPKQSLKMMKMEKPLKLMV